jgi:hypothetical protein
MVRPPGEKSGYKIWKDPVREFIREKKSSKDRDRGFIQKKMSGTDS